MRKIFYGLFILIVSLFALIGCDKPHVHQFGEWKVSKVATCLAEGVEKRVCECGETETKTIAREAHTIVDDEEVPETCTEKGKTAGSHCLVCGEVMVAQESIDKLGHLFENWHEEVSATTTQEGKIVSICSRENCDDTDELKQLMKPALTLSGDKITWNAISNATGYNLYINNTFIDLGNVLEYIVPFVEGVYNFALEAYTTMNSYSPVGKKSDILTVEVSYGPNLQQYMGTDFEGFTGEKSLTNNWDTFYGNFSTGNVGIIFDGNNKYAKLLPIVNGDSAVLTKACNTNILKAGTYKFKFDVYLGYAVDGELSFNIFNGEWLFAENLVIDLSNLNSNQWTSVSVEFTLISDKTADFANLDLKYIAETVNENNYVFVDNFEIIDSVTNGNIDTDTNNGFDLFDLVQDNSMNTPGWKVDSFGRNVIYVGDKLENELILENGNTVIKAYTSDLDHTDLTFAAHRDIAQAGIYKLSMKVKLGSEAVMVDNIGFRFSSNNPLGTMDMVFEGLDKLSSTEWVTLDIYFGVGNTVNVDFVNIDLWVFTHNDVVHSSENYVLIDDVAISIVYIE